jgi:hypothetical protein
VSDQPVLLDVFRTRMRNGVRQFSGFLAGVVLSLVAGQPAQAQGCLTWSGANSPYPSLPNSGNGSDMCNAIIAQHNAATAPFGNTWTFAGASPAGAPPANGATLTCTENGTHQPGGTSLGSVTESTTAIQIACPACAIAAGSPADLEAQASGTTTVTAMANGAYCANNCEYKPVPTTLLLGDGVHYAMGGAQSTGNSCGTSDTPATAGSNCFTLHGESICAEAATGMATVNGDLVNMNGTAPPTAGTCVAYASGGSLCVLPATPTGGTQPPMPTPPGPDNGTAGTPAVPTAQGELNGKVANYYSAATTAASTGLTQTNSSAAGTPAGQAASAAGAAASAAAPDDCGDGSACQGVVPTLPAQADIATTTQSYYSAIQAAPIVQAFAGIETAFAIANSGECQTFTLSMFGHSYVMDAQCTILQEISSVLGTIMLAIYTLTGVRIVMSA